MKERCRYFLGIVSMAFIVGVCGCGKAENSDGSAGSVEEDYSVIYSVEDYKDRLYDGRVSLADYESRYTDDMETVSDTDYKVLHFDDVVFEDFPDTDRLVLVKAGEEEISVDETIGAVENWLEDIGKSDEVDLESELGINKLNHPYMNVSEDEATLELDEIYPLFFNHLSELKSGTGAIIYRDDCYIHIAQNGIVSMSDGKVSDYLNEKGISDIASNTPFRRNFGEKIASGRVSDMEKTTYPLLDGELTVGEGAEIVENYFAKGTPLARPEGVDVKAESVAVYQIEDIYCYEYALRRYYYNVPVVWSNVGQYSFYGSYCASGDSKRAYVVDRQGVTAYYGTNDGEALYPLIQETSLIGMADAAKILSGKLASQINISVEFVGLVYLPLTFENSSNPNEKIFFPCWRFAGVNRVKGEIWSYMWMR